MEFGGESGESLIFIGRRKHNTNGDGGITVRSGLSCRNMQVKSIPREEERGPEVPWSKSR